MKLQLILPLELVSKLDLDNFNIERSLTAKEQDSKNGQTIKVIASDVDEANDIACEIIPDLMSLSPDYQYHDFYTMLNVWMDEFVEDCEIYFQSDVEEFIDGDKDEQAFYHYMDSLGLIDGDLTEFINTKITPLGASLKFIS